jgi:hypothetical protein
VKPIFIILLPLLLTSCLKASIAPISSHGNTGINKANIAAVSSPADVDTNKADTLTSNAVVMPVIIADAYDWFNGTKGTALIQVTCINCSAIATIGDVTVPFLFNEQGIGLLRYTPRRGLTIRVAVCPESVKTIKAEIFDAANASLYSYSRVSGNWNGTYVIK